MSYDIQLEKIREERKLIDESLVPIYAKLYDLQEKEKQIQLEKDLASGSLSKMEELEFRRAMHIFQGILKQASSCSLYLQKEEADNKKKFSFEVSTHYSLRNETEPCVSMYLTIKSTVVPVSNLLNEMMKVGRSVTYWQFDSRYNPLHIDGTLSEEEYEAAKEEEWDNETIREMFE